MLMLPEKKSWKKAGILIPEIMDYRSFLCYGPKHAKGAQHRGKISKYIVDIYNV